LTDSERRADQELVELLGETPVDASLICSRLRDTNRQERLRNAVNNIFPSRLKKLADIERAEVSAAAPRAQNLQKAWQQREAKLTEQLRTKRAGADQLLNQLPWYIGIFSLFGLSIIAMVRLFHDEVQMEWVASGQVIQFATVMVLLIVIAALGIAHILNENTLGTLLGGVAGYVLSQGVGRAVARATERAVDVKKTPLGSHDKVRTWLLPLISRHAGTIIADENLALASDLQLDSQSLSSLTESINHALLLRKGKTLSQSDVEKALTVGGLISLVADLLS
jgi:hypothetical protein